VTLRPLHPDRSAVLDVPSGRIAALQGIRGVAVVLVVLSHCFPASAETSALGAMGVTMFFTLSGFLITGVLLDSRRENLRHLVGFYGARAVRLLPALFALILVWIVSGRAATEFAGYAATAAFYVENFFAVQHDHQILAHTWSLAVEEQFYVLWPLLLLPITALRPKMRLIVIGMMIVASALARVVLGYSGSAAFAYSALSTNAYALLLGCWLRLLPFNRIQRPWLGWVGLAAIAFLAAAGLHLKGGAALTPIATAFATALVIAGSLHGNPLLAARPIVFLGAVSYAWYLWHWPMLWFTGFTHSAPGSLLISLAALVVATLSTKLLEEPLRRAYQRWLRGRKTRMPARLSDAPSA
jgi:peptidoglycan/LPS O-acetylase OafA/YrhL